MLYPWDYDCFSKDPAAVAWRKKFEDYAKTGSRYTLWPGHDEWTFDSWQKALTTALSEAKRVGSHVPICRVYSEYPTMNVQELCVATPEGLIEETRR
jgi:hypothetical protein